MQNAESTHVALNISVRVFPPPANKKYTSIASPHHSFQQIHFLDGRHARAVVGVRPQATAPFAEPRRKHRLHGEVPNARVAVADIVANSPSEGLKMGTDVVATNPPLEGLKMGTVVATNPPSEGLKMGTVVATPKVTAAAVQMMTIAAAATAVELVLFAQRTVRAHPTRPRREPVFLARSPCRGRLGVTVTTASTSFGFLAGGGRGSWRLTFARISTPRTAFATTTTTAFFIALLFLVAPVFATVAVVVVVVIVVDASAAAPDASSPLATAFLATAAAAVIVDAVLVVSSDRWQPLPRSILFLNR